jgi:predicted enzyme related to lactoylglutathione lyase
MPVRLHHIVIDAHDLPGLARFWTQALSWKVLSEREREIVIGADDNAPVGICFMPVTDPKTVKNRVHLDLTASAADRDDEIERLLALGARRADIGQTGAESWTVLADPEGNEFCVVRTKETLTRLGLVTGRRASQVRSAACADAIVSSARGHWRRHQYSCVSHGFRPSRPGGSLPVQYW